MITIHGEAANGVFLGILAYDFGVNRRLFDVNPALLWKVRSDVFADWECTEGNLAKTRATKKAFRHTAILAHFAMSF
jgi:hypothetical protein